MAWQIQWALKEDTSLAFMCLPESWNGDPGAEHIELKKLDLLCAPSQDISTVVAERAKGNESIGSQIELKFT